MDPSASSLLRNVPLFPLPGVVLFPGQRLPLRIFEPRYRQMTSDALSGDLRICVVQLKEETEPPSTALERKAHPAFHEVGGVGRIVDHEKLDDGRYNLMLEGEDRVRVEELPFLAPYRRGDLRILETQPGTAAATGQARALSLIAERFVAAVRRVHPTVDLAVPMADEPEALADACAQHFVASAELQQVLLEELDGTKRVSLCLDLLMRQLEPASTSLN